jgi:purine nucleosidase
MARKQVIIDVDPGIGVLFRDIDDALAIFLLLSSPAIDLQGITVNFGNVPAPTGYAIAQEVLKIAGTEIPLFKGADLKRNLGKPNPAVEFMIRTVNENPGMISLLGVAPLTNIATAMMLDRGFAAKLKELIIMGGSLSFKPFNYVGEFNFHKDSSAAARVLSAPIKKTLITMDVCSQVVFMREHLEQIRSQKSRVAQYIAARIPSWLLFNRVLFRKGGFFPWDVVAAAHVIDATLFDAHPCLLSIQEGGARAGRIYNLARQNDFTERNGLIPVNIPLALDAKRFMKLFIDGLLQLS